MKPQLAESIDPRDLTAYTQRSDWWFEQKLDGCRALIVVTADGVSVLNRSGDPKTGKLPSTEPFAALSQLDGGVVLDSEVVGGQFVLFDIPKCGAYLDDLAPYDERRRVLEVLFATALVGHESVALLPTARTIEQKQQLALAAIKAGSEGIMVKRHDAAYDPGHRSKAMLKAKFTKELDAVVSACRDDGKDSAELSCYDDDGNLVTIGRSSLIGKSDQIAPGSVVAVRYLYATADGRIYQPRIISGPRDDKAPHECLTSQMRYTDRTLLDIV